MKLNRKEKENQIEESVWFLDDTPFTGVAFCTNSGWGWGEFFLSVESAREVCGADEDVCEIEFVEGRIQLD